jgi:molybdopterin-guanine dinucleotide biosynthesis protein A
MKEQQPLYGLILAGGRSERMGQDKGALAYHGRAQTQHLAGLLAPYVEKVFVSVRAEQRDAPHLRGLALICDQYPVPSPLNGILSTMQEMPWVSWLVVAVDMPHVDREAIEMLIAARHPEKLATCFESPVKGGPDPLFAIWEGYAFPPLEHYLEQTQNHVCPRHALTSLGAHVIAGGVPPRVLDNINTPQEWAALAEAS